MCTAALGCQRPWKAENQLSRILETPQRGGDSGGEGFLHLCREGGNWTKLLSSDPFTREGQAKASPAQWCLNPLRSFQSDPFARAHRISAWPHVRARLPLGKADTTPRLSEAELNGPPGPRGAEQKSQKLLRSRRPRPEPSRRCRECRGNTAGTGHQPGDGQGPGSIINADTH